MRRRKIIISVALLALVAGLAIFCVELSRGPVLAWKVLSVRPTENYWVRDHMEQQCCRVEIEVSNITPSEVIVDWNRDETSFQIAGRWENLGISALMPYLGPNESRAFPVYVPRQAQACRLLMHYEHGPLWSRADQFLQKHNINLPLNLFTLGMNLDKKLPGHYKRLSIEVEIPSAGKTNLPPNLRIGGS